MTRYVGIAATAALLAIVAAAAFLTAGEDGVSFVGIAALLFLLEMPAFGWRMLGGGRLGTWVAAVAPPLLIGGLYLLKGYLEYRGRCADVCGVELVLFLFLLLPLVLATGTFVAWIATGMIRPPEEG